MAKALGIVITDGVGFRNFVLSDFISEAQKQFNRVVVFSCLPKSAYETLNIDCEIIELEVFEENFLTWFFRKGKEVAHLNLHKEGNFGIEDNWKANFSRAKTTRGYATRFIYKWVKHFHSEKWINQYEKWQQLTFKRNQLTKQYKTILKEKGITSLFFTHQRPSYIAPLIYAAVKQKVKTTAFIFSWDNLASKGRMAGNFDYYLVWSDLMKNELLHFYTSVHPEQIEVVGTPQFEPYILERYGMTEQDFLRRFHLDESKKTILFSCGDVSTSPNDPLYIEIIAKAIEDKILHEEVNLLVRTSPAEAPKRFAYLAEKYPFVRWNYPDWHQARSDHQEGWSQRIPSVQDLSDLKAVLSYSDVNVNMLSTMSLDALLFDKPVINTVFGNGENELGNDQRFLNYAHIEKVVESNAVTITKNAQELIAALNYCLEFPEYKIKEQNELLALELGRPLEGTSNRIATVLKKWS